MTTAGGPMDDDEYEAFEARISAWAQEGGWLLVAVAGPGTRPTYLLVDQRATDVEVGVGGGWTLERVERYLRENS